MEPLNRLLERDDQYIQVARGTGEGAPAVEMKTLRRWRAPESPLPPIGEELARFVVSDDFQHVKACEGSARTPLFADRTRSRRKANG